MTDFNFDQFIQAAKFISDNENKFNNILKNCISHRFNNPSILSI